MDRYPNLKDMYFEHYKRLIYMSQEPTDELISEAQEAAEYLGLTFEHHHVGYGDLGSAMSLLSSEASLGNGVHYV